jgi:hypothetical protein
MTQLHAICEPDLTSQNQMEQAVELVDEYAFGSLPNMPRPFRHPIRFLAWLVRCLFGIASLILLLAVIAAIPIVNFLALGYLLEVEGRVARTGRLRNAFPLLPFAPRIGAIVLGVGGWLFVVRLVADQAAVATQINPDGSGLGGFKVVFSVLVAIHLCLALARGGSPSCFLRPIKNLRWFLKRRRDGNYWVMANQHIATFVKGLRLKHHFWLGLRGFAGAFIWLVIPSALLATASRPEGIQVLITVFGGLCLILVFMWIPFLQARFAAEQRFSAMFELRAIRDLYGYSSMGWLLAVVLTYVLSLPLYLAKVQLPPSDLIWLITVIFVVSIYPTKVATGWAYHRALKKRAAALTAHSDRPFVLPLIGRGAMLPLVGVYVFLVFFTQAIGKHGKLALFEHHAFLVPAPFLLSGG